MSETLIQITETNFDEILQSSSLPVLLDLWATWCKPCMSMKAVFERVARNFSDRLVVAQLNIDAYKTLSSRLGIRSVPALILFKDGVEMARTSGSMSYARLASWLAKQNIVTLVGDSNESTAAQDDIAWNAFYGDAELKQFFHQRIRTLAEDGQIEFSRFPRWTPEGGSLSAAFNKRSDPRVFERTTGMPISAGLAMEFAFIASPEATAALFEAIQPSADLSLVAPHLMLAWLGDTDTISAAFLGDMATDELRRDWAHGLRTMLDGELIPPSAWTSLRQRAQEIGKQLHSEKAIAKSAIEMLVRLCPPPEPDRAGAWLGILKLHGTYLALNRPLFAAGFTQRDFDLERIRDSFYRAAAGGRPGADLSKQELDALHARWRTEHADDHARLDVVLETSHQMRIQGHAPIASILLPIIAGSPVLKGSTRSA